MKNYSYQLKQNLALPNANVDQAARAIRNMHNNASGQVAKQINKKPAVWTPSFEIKPSTVKKVQ